MSRRAQGLARYGICYAQVPGGRRMPMLKILQTNFCRNNCAYCATRRDRDIRRTSFLPDDLARCFMELHRAGKVRGLFLSSGICGSADQTMERMVATVDILRRQYEYRGYVHLKCLPGASREAIRQAVRLADRTSINMEAPTTRHLQQIAPDKDLRGDIIRRLMWISEETAGTDKIPAGITTQLVVGAAGERDREIMTATEWLYRNVHLRRAYYSGFNPVRRTPLEHLPPILPMRQHRLYQADWLLRFYGFSVGELPFTSSGNLPTDVDPKLAWARQHPEVFPIEVNAAEPEELMRVPGIGAIGAQRICAARAEVPFRRLEQLRRLGLRVGRAAAFITVAGRMQTASVGGRGVSASPEPCLFPDV